LLERQNKGNKHEIMWPRTERSTTNHI